MRIWFDLITCPPICSVDGSRRRIRVVVDDVNVHRRRTEVVGGASVVSRIRLLKVKNPLLEHFYFLMLRLGSREGVSNKTLGEPDR